MALSIFRVQIISKNTYASESFGTFARSDALTNNLSDREQSVNEL